MGRIRATPTKRAKPSADAGQNKAKATKKGGGRKPALRRYPGESMRKQGLCGALGLPEGQGDAAFSDVRAGAWYAEAVCWAVGAGVTNGVGEGRFAPDETCTRAQIVTFLWRSYNG